MPSNCFCAESGIGLDSVGFGLAGLTDQGTVETVTREVNYFHEHKARMDYRAGQHCGEPIGSGPGEATCRQTQCRFKHTGQFWSRQGGAALVCLETFSRNGRRRFRCPHRAAFNLATN